jgi:hypothetical protein
VVRTHPTVPLQFRLTPTRRTVCRNRRIRARFRACIVSVCTTKARGSGEFRDLCPSVSISNPKTSTSAPKWRSEFVIERRVRSNFSPAAGITGKNTGKTLGRAEIGRVHGSRDADSIGLSSIFQLEIAAQITGNEFRDNRERFSNNRENALPRSLLFARCRTRRECGFLLAPREGDFAPEQPIET